MEDITISVTHTFKIVPFTPELPDNDGKCIQCEGKDYCGGGDKLKCPCSMGEQLIITKTEFL